MKQLTQLQRDKLLLFVSKLTYRSIQRELGFNLAGEVARDLEVLNLLEGTEEEEEDDSKSEPRGSSSNRKG